MEAELPLGRTPAVANAFATAMAWTGQLLLGSDLDRQGKYLI
jgi:hypothetical protein